LAVASERNHRAWFESALCSVEFVNGGLSAD
jgi:hypothetical protein